MSMEGLLSSISSQCGIVLNNDMLYAIVLIVLQPFLWNLVCYSLASFSICFLCMPLFYFEFLFQICTYGWNKKRKPYSTTDTTTTITTTTATTIIIIIIIIIAAITTTTTTTNYYYYYYYYYLTTIIIIITIYYYLFVHQIFLLGCSIWASHALHFKISWQ